MKVHSAYCDTLFPYIYTNQLLLKFMYCGFSKHNRREIFYFAAKENQSPICSLKVANLIIVNDRFMAVKQAIWPSKFILAG